MKNFLVKLPEYILLAGACFYWYSSGTIINPIAIGLIILLIFQIIKKNRVVGLVISGLVIMASLYMLMALMSEFNEFTTVNSEAKQMLFVGLAYFLSTIIVSGTMIYKYVSMDLKND
jgi:phosphoglycerol transferase MdoB-like AlkP superfamily enzyme